MNLDGNVRHYHENHLRKYHVRVESVLYDSSVYQFNVDDECLNYGADDVDVNPDYKQAIAGEYVQYTEPYTLTLCSDEP